MKDNNPDNPNNPQPYRITYENNNTVHKVDHKGKTDKNDKTPERVSFINFNEKTKVKPLANKHLNLNTSSKIDYIEGTPGIKYIRRCLCPVCHTDNIDIEGLIERKVRYSIVKSRDILMEEQRLIPGSNQIKCLCCGWLCAYDKINKDNDNNIIDDDTKNIIHKIVTEPYEYKEEYLEYVQRFINLKYLSSISDLLENRYNINPYIKIDMDIEIFRNLIILKPQGEKTGQNLNEEHSNHSLMGSIISKSNALYSWDGDWEKGKKDEADQGKIYLEIKMPKDLWIDLIKNIVLTPQFNLSNINSGKIIRFDKTKLIIGDKTSLMMKKIKSHKSRYEGYLDQYYLSQNQNDQWSFYYTLEVGMSLKGREGTDGKILDADVIKYHGVNLPSYRFILGLEHEVDIDQFIKNCRSNKIKLINRLIKEIGIDNKYIRIINNK